MPTYDVIIPCAQKDYVKIGYCVEGLKFLNPAPDNIYIVSKNKVIVDGTTWIDENSVLDIRPSDIAYRRNNWIYQQLIKLCQDFTQEWYFTIDSDIFLKRPFNLFDEIGLPIYRISNHDQCHAPYFDFMQKMWGLQKVIIPTFINDTNIFRKKLCRELIPDQEEFVSKMNQIISDDCLLGEPEVYGNYMAYKYPYSFTLGEMTVDMHGKYLPELYTTWEIEQILKKETESDAVAIHSWS